MPQDWLGGVLLIDKSSGPSSFDVIRRVRKHLRIKKVGHTGTLDPMATGLMVLCLGHATRVVPYLTAEDKVYDAVIRLGVTSDTYDAEGTITRIQSDETVCALSSETIHKALSSFDGWIEQVPPMFSAIKIDGERLYAKARRGETVDVPARRVRIDECRILDHSGVELSVRIACSKGTYIRSIAHDLGQMLGTGGMLIGLRRHKVGALSLENAIALDALDELTPEALLDRCLSIGDALCAWPRVEMTWAQTKKLKFGQTLSSSGFPQTEFLAYDPDSRLLAMMQGGDETGQTKILRGFPSV
jgi:tRNA pseudouridine55 synthase